MKALVDAARELIRPFARRRRFHAYCLGTPKSGTTSVASLLRPRYRSGHEADTGALFKRLQELKEGVESDAGMREFIRDRDRQLYLEMDSSGLNVYLLEYLLEEFPRARFVLTFRDCYSFLESAVNHRVTRPRPPDWEALQQFRYGSGFEYSVHEEFLKQHRLPNVDAYLSNWAEHNQKVISRVPPERLLIIRTHELSRKLDELAEFLKIPREHIATSRAHRNEAPTKVWTPGQLAPEFYRQKVKQHCGSLLDAYFPEFNSPTAVPPTDS